MRHGLVSLATVGLMPLEQVSLHAQDMSVRLFVGYGDDRAAAQGSVADGMATAAGSGTATRPAG